VGEVRTGWTALSLFLAQMSDHPGLSAVHRLAVIMFADAQVSMEAAREIFIQAVDLVVQVGWKDGKRRIQGVWETGSELEAGNVAFRRIYQLGEERLGETLRQRL
jgi:pilus assembly protein CpaF